MTPSEFRATVHFCCVLAASVSTAAFIYCMFAFPSGATGSAVVTMLALGGAVWAHHLEAEYNRKLRECRRSVNERRIREAGQGVGPARWPSEVVRPARDEAPIALLRTDPEEYFRRTRRQLP